MISKEGFSVVAPIRMMLPFSTYGRNASCCALLKRCISSTNKRVLIPILRLFSAWTMTSLISFMPLVTALKLMNWALVRFAIIPARVVLPTPGGPQKIMDGILSCSMSWRSSFPFPKDAPVPQIRPGLPGAACWPEDCILLCHRIMTSVPWLFISPFRKWICMITKKPDILMFWFILL